MSAVSPPTSNWVVRERNRAAESVLERELGIPSIVAAILVQRGYSDPAAADHFLNPSLDRLHDPRLLPDYEPAMRAILAARESKELIFVHGDYDVDGVTSAALFNRFLSKIGCRVQTHVPHRMKEGYGIHRSAVEAAHAAGAKLFLTCDCGVSAHEQVEMANKAGMQVVVTDHHSIGANLPAATAVVNPHRSDSIYPFSELSGAGVVFKLCEGISRELGHEPKNYYRAFLDLAALGTIADVMPLIDENRIIARFGLERLADTKKAGLQALIREANINTENLKTMRAYHVGFVLGPRLNAAGRIDDAAIALKLLLENDPVEADRLAKQIEQVNTARRSEQLRICEEAAQMVTDCGFEQRNVIMVANEGWHAGIVGIVAGRLVEQFRRPCFVLTVDPATGQCKGSARGIPNFNLADAIRAFPDLFVSGGGHAMAAGCCFELEKIDKIRDALDGYAGERLTEEDFRPSVRVDMEIDLDEVTFEAAEALSRLEPFGFENPEPLFLARDVTLAQVLPTKSAQHVRVALQKGPTNVLKGMAFGIGERVSAIGSGASIDLLLKPTIDEWRGSRTLGVQVKDFVTL
jgi:single-stranded-DNA-specific exonuclease